MKITLLSPVVHDGKEYADGDTVEIKDEAQAQALIETGAAKEAGKKSKAEAKAEAEAAAKAAAEAADAAAREASAGGEQRPEGNQGEQAPGGEG
jgi:ribosomal protein L9